MTTEFIDGFTTKDGKEIILDKRDDLYVIAVYEDEDELGLDESIELETEDKNMALEEFEFFIKHHKKIGSFQAKSIVGKSAKKEEDKYTVFVGGEDVIGSSVSLDVANRTAEYYKKRYSSVFVGKV